VGIKTGAELERALGLSGTDLRRLVSRLRRRGDPIASDRQGCFYDVTADGGAMKNEDVSKNAALIPPAFGSASADTLNTGSPLTPNPAPSYQSAAGAVINGSSAVIQPPAIGGAVFVPGPSSRTTATPSTSIPSTSISSTGRTEVTSDLYYKGGYLAVL